MRRFTSTDVVPGHLTCVPLRRDSQCGARFFPHCSLRICRVLRQVRYDVPTTTLLRASQAHTVPSLPIPQNGLAVEGLCLRKGGPHRRKGKLTDGSIDQPERPPQAPVPPQVDRPRTGTRTGGMYIGRQGDTPCRTARDGETRHNVQSASKTSL